MAQEQLDEERLNIIKENIRNEGISPADIQGRQIASKELLSTGVPTGAGFNPENLFLLEKALNILKPTQPVRTQSNLISQTSMPSMYDTSPYRALDIIGAGIGRRPTQEAYFNRLETIQNERLQDEYNRRTDTPEAQNLQSLMKETFPNLGENIINKISPDYISKNYPMIAQIAESKTGAISKQRKDEESSNLMKQFFPEYNGPVNSENFNLIFSKLSKDKERSDLMEQKKLESEIEKNKLILDDETARDNFKLLYPNTPLAKLNLINAKNVNSILAAEDKKEFEREKKASDQRNREDMIRLTKSVSPQKEGSGKDGEKGSDKKFRNDMLEHFDSISKLETTKNYIDKLNRSYVGSLTPDISYTTKATSATLDALAQPQIKALAGPGAITDTERENFRPLVITSKDPKELALNKFNDSMSNALSIGIKKLEIAYQTGAVNDNDYQTYLKKYIDLKNKYKVQIQQ